MMDSALNTRFDTERKTYDGFSIKYLVLKLAILYIFVFSFHILREYLGTVILWLCFIFLSFFGLFVSYVHQLHYKMKCP